MGNLISPVLTTASTSADDAGVHASLKRKMQVGLGVVALGWAIAIVVWSQAPFALSYDDAYYYFTIARNWADGHASTFGLIDKTNGYHPLWQLLSIIPFAAGLEGLAAVRALLLGQLVLWMVTWQLIIGHVVESIDGFSRLNEHPVARRWCERIMIVVIIALAANPFLFRLTVNGLESGLVVPVGATILWLATRVKGRFITRATTSQRFQLGLLLALAILSRTDALVLVATIVAAMCLERSRPTSPISLQRRVVSIAQVVVIPAVVTMVYLAINQAVFGTAMQISGTIKRLPLTGSRIALTLLWVALGLGVLLGARRTIGAKSKLGRIRRFYAATGFYAAFCVGLVGYYTTLQAVPYMWYFAPLGLYFTWSAILIAADMTEVGLVEHFAREKAFRPVGLAAGSVVMVPLLVMAAIALGGLRDSGRWSLLTHDAHAGQWIDENLPKDAVVASWDAGAIGFFAHRPMVNLDGVVNTLAWSHAMQDGTTAAFLRARNVGWVANHGHYVDGAEPGIHDLLRRYFGDAAVRDLQTAHVEHYLYTGTLDGSRSDRSTKVMATFVYRLSTP